MLACNENIANVLQYILNLLYKTTFPVNKIIIKIKQVGKVPL
jgi:hypothetical protein